MSQYLRPLQSGNRSTAQGPSTAPLQTLPGQVTAMDSFYWLGLVPGCSLIRRQAMKNTTVGAFFPIPHCCQQSPPRGGNYYRLLRQGLPALPSHQHADHSTGHFCWRVGMHKPIHVTSIEAASTIPRSASVRQWIACCTNVKALSLSSIQDKLRQDAARGTCVPPEGGQADSKRDTWLQTLVMWQLARNI